MQKIWTSGMSDPILEYNSFIKLLEGRGLFMYDKKIAYLHYIKNGELIGNAGHIKVTQRGNITNIEVYVREAYGILNGCYYIQNLGGNPFEHKINIEGGQAVYKKRIEAGKNEKGTPPYGLKIEIEKDEYLEAVWRTKEEAGDRNVSGSVKESMEVPDLRKEKDLTVNRIGTNAAERPHERQYMEREEKNEENGRQEETAWTDTWDRAEKLAEMNLADPEENARLNEREKPYEEALYERGIPKKAGQNGTWKNLTFSVPVETYEDKWNELCKKYEVIHPFGNKEEYLSLSPKDFIIFPEKYQHLVNNSFLLHGYYNYRHVILGKKEEGGQNIYYLGVPGVYYEREKMVAIMFGFEGFECGEKRALAGGFGYYMRRVEL